MTRGFTFFDLAVVLLLIAIVGVLAIPEALTRKQVDEEVAAVDALRWIVAAELRYQEEALADRDGDGVGEFGFLGDLLGAGYSGAPLGAPPPGHAARIGNYGVSVLLPDGQGRPVPAARAAEVDPELAGHAFLAVAWPLHEHMAGYRAYAANQGVLVFENANPDGSLCGWDRPAPPVPRLATRLSGRVHADPALPPPWGPLLRREQVKAVAAWFDRTWKLEVPEVVQDLLDRDSGSGNGSEPKKPR